MFSSHRTTALLIGLIAASPASASDLICRGQILTGSYDDNVVVPTRQTCVIDGATIKANVILRSGASVVIAGGAFIEGNVEGRDALWVTIEDSTVKGNVKFERTRGVPPGASANVIARSTIESNVEWLSSARRNASGLLLQDNLIKGNVQAQRNVAGVEIVANEIDGDLQFFSNRLGASLVLDNTIKGNLQCKQNRPAPGGGGNAVCGNAEDQCAPLALPDGC